MNKTAIKNFAIWARNKLIADISYRAGLMGITVDGIHAALPQSTGQTEFYDIGTAEPYAITGEAIRQRRHLVELIQRKEKDTDYKTAYKYIIEEVAYTWFNRLIAVRFMEVNDYLPSHIRVLSSDTGKLEPDLVTTPFDAELEFTNAEQQAIIDLKNANKLDEVFRLLFIKQCNTLNEILPALFEKTNDYTELLLNLSVIDQDGVVYHLVNDIPEEDFDVERGGQVEIIGWLYQYYNTEPKNEAFAKKGKITKEEVPAVTQLFTPDWIVRYMVENSLGRLWVEGHPNEDLKAGWKYYLEEAEQEAAVQEKLDEIRKEYANLNPEDIKIIDPCMGSGHILVYAFDVLMQIYESAGYGQRDAARSILENNLYGLDIDDRAFQMAYFAVMMKARQYNRRILNAEYKPRLYSIQESNGINRNQIKYLGLGMPKDDKKMAESQLNYLLDAFWDAKEYGSILTVKPCEWDLLYRFVSDCDVTGQMSFDAIGLDETIDALLQIIDQARCLSGKYNISVTNPPYMILANGNAKLNEYVKNHYPDSKTDLFAVFMERCIMYVVNSGLISMITQHSWMFITSYEKLRKKIQQKEIVNMIHLGARAFDEIAGEVVQTTAFVLANWHISGYFGRYSRLVNGLNEKDKCEKFLQKEEEYCSAQDRYIQIPGCPVAYWVDDKVFAVFDDKHSMGKHFDIKAGMCTGENAKYIMLWQEVDFTKSSLVLDTDYLYTPHNKGGEYRRWYGNRDCFLKYNPSALKEMELNAGFRHDGKEYYFKEHIGWSKITSSKSSFRFYDDSFTFDSAGLGLFTRDRSSIKVAMGLLNSNVADMLIGLLNPTLNVTPIIVKKLPFDEAIIDVKEIVARVDECIEISKADWDSFETSWDFTRHPLLKQWSDKTSTVETAFTQWEAECINRKKTLKANEEKLNYLFSSAYGLQEIVSTEVADADLSVRTADIKRDVKSLLSYAVGCMFGRYSLDFSGLAFAGGSMESKKYSSFIPDEDNIIPITDEEYLEDDIVSRFCTWMKIAYGEQNLEKNLDFIAKALGNKGGSSREIIRNYFLNDFFKDHCQTYSVTGSGKRPIYWLFDSGKQNGFKALIYLHRYNADTIGNLRIDYLHRLQRAYESEVGRMQDMIDHSTNAREVGQATKRRDKLTKQLKECREYDEKLAHLALSRIELDLDDGVKVNYRKLQTANDGKFYEVLADSKNIMSKK